MTWRRAILGWTMLLYLRAKSLLLLWPMFSSVSTQKFEFLVDLTRNRKRQFYLKSFPKLRRDVLFSGQKRRMNWSDLFTMKKWNENWGETADTFILQRMTLSGRSLIKHVQTWKHDSVVEHTQGEVAIVCMDNHFVRNVVSVIKSTIVWNGYKTERGLQNNYHN